MNTLRTAGGYNISPYTPQQYHRRLAASGFHFLRTCLSGDYMPSGIFA